VREVACRAMARVLTRRGSPAGEGVRLVMARGEIAQGGGVGKCDM
jgi:hypothetical protein